MLGGKGNASAVIANGREAAKNGDAQKVTFQFSKTGAVSLDAFVVPATSYFEGVGPSELPKPKPRDHALGRAVGHPVLGHPDRRRPRRAPRARAATTAATH